MALRDLRGAFFMRSFAVTRKGRVAVLKRVFVAPDPGRLRLRFAARGVLGIGLAVALCGLAGHSLVAAITGGLAALLALFTVTDATVRGQAVTTALLPAVGLPVLGLAAALHDVPVARDLAFLAVVGAGCVRAAVGAARALPRRVRVHDLLRHVKGATGNQSRIAGVLAGRSCAGVHSASRMCGHVLSGESGCVLTTC